MRDLLGGKGANVAEMTRVLGADRVPAGLHDHDRGVRRLHARRPARARRHGRAGRRGARAPAGARRQAARRRRRPAAGLRPLRRARVDARDARHRPQPRPQRHVRRGPRAARPSNERFAWDSYRRFVQMFGNVVARHRRRGVRGRDRARPRRERGRRGGHRARRRRAARSSRDRFKALYAEHTGEDFPQDPQEQLRLAIRAVFDSWTGDRAVDYRRINRIPDDWGTAVNVQQMVFGNKGDTSGSGVAFSRDEVTGAPEPSGDFLANAQGEDVVSGVRTPRDIAEMKDWLPDAHAAADGDPAHARAPLRGHAGHRVHGRGGAALHAPDAQRQAAGAGRGALRASTPSTRGC